VAIQGSLEEAPLPDVLQLLSLGKKTGCLSLTERELQGEICLDKGMVSHAAVFSRRDRLGDMLVRTGRITQQQLDDAVAVEQREGHHVSQTLLASGQVERTELERFVRAQVEEAVYFMFTWRSGSFAFTSSVRPKRQEFLVAINPEGLLLEGARRVDEWSLIEKKVPSLDLVFQIDRARLDGAPTLTPEQQQIVPLIDGTRDVHGIIERTGMTEFDVGKAIYGLITAGFAKLVERRAAMRHLDYRELLAYVVREAEFAEPERRRAAARHIADCATCSQRLKTIHVRRTGTIPTLSTQPDQPAAAVPDAVTTEVTAAEATLAPGGVERRVSDRRMRDDRRAEERRQGEERRQSRSPEWEQPSRDRRSGSDRRAEGRRISERRVAAGGRESAAIVAARPLTLPQRSRGGERRVTGPRRIRPSGLDQAAPAQPKRDTGDGIRLRPADDTPAVPEIVAPTAERSPEPPPVPNDAPPGPRAAAVDSHSEDDAEDVPTAQTTEARARAPAELRARAERTERREAAPRPKRDRRKEAEVPDLPVEAAVKTERPREQERVPAAPALDSLATVEQRGEASPAGTTAPPPTEQAPAASIMPETDTTPAPPQPPPATVQPPPPPDRGRPPARTTDIEWLVSPDEANHLLRTSRVGLAAPTTEADSVKPGRAERPAKAKAAPPPQAEVNAKKLDAAPPTATPPKAKSKATPAAERRAPRPHAEEVLKDAVTTPAPDAPQSSRDRRAGHPVREVGWAAADHVAVHRDVDATPARTSPIRWLPIAAAAVVLIGIGWVARPLLQTGSGTPPAPTPQPIARLGAAPTPTAAPVEVPPEEITTPPADVESPPQTPARAAAPARPVAREAAPPPVRQATPAVAPPPAVATVRGTVRDGASGAALAGVRVTIPGTAFSATTDASGTYAFRDVPAGRITLEIAADGRLPGTREVVLRSGEPAQVDFALTQPAPPPETAPPPAAVPTAAPPTAVAAREPDAELESGNWTLTDAATASARLRNTIATIPELWVESIAITETGSRPRARVALLTPAGERLVLTETRSGAPVIGGTPRVTALRIIPGSDAYPVTTGTASFGTLLVTAKTTLDPETLRSLLTKLAELE